MNYLNHYCEKRPDSKYTSIKRYDILKRTLHRIKNMNKNLDFDEILYKKKIQYDYSIYLAISNHAKRQKFSSINEPVIWSQN